MLVVDASCLYALVARAPESSTIRARLGRDDELIAPHIIDVEVLGVIRHRFQRGELDRTGAERAIDEMQNWPGERVDHRALLWRAWELRNNVRHWDAMYVALAETVDAPLITTDRRLTRASGPQCRFELITLES